MFHLGQALFQLVYRFFQKRLILTIALCLRCPLWTSSHIFSTVQVGVTSAGLELEVKRGTAKIAVEGLVKRRAPQHFQQVWKDTTANLLLQGGAPRHLQFEEILSIDLKRLVVLVITRGSRSGMIRGWLITAEGHTTAREKGIMALECRR